MTFHPVVAHQNSQQMPLLDAPIVDPESGIASEPFLRFMLNLYLRGTSPGGAAQPQTLSGSPFIFSGQNVTGTLLSDGGTLSLSRDGGKTFFPFAGGAIRLLVGDQCEVAWAGPQPNVVWLPDSL